MVKKESRFERVANDDKFKLKDPSKPLPYSPKLPKKYIPPGGAIGYDTEGRLVFPPGKTTEEIVREIAKGGRGEVRLEDVERQRRADAAAKAKAAAERERLARERVLEARRLAQERAERLREAKTKKERTRVAKLYAQKQLDVQKRVGLRRRDILKKPIRKKEPAIREKKVSKEPKQPRIKAVAREIAIGETGKRFIGITTLPGRAVPQITATKIKGRLEKGKLPAYRTAAILLPTTPLEGGVVGGTAAVFPYVPAVVKGRLEKEKLLARTAAILLPTTPLEVGVVGGTAAVFPYVPAVVRVPVTTAIAAERISVAADPTKLPEERIAAGIVGGVAVAGTVTETIPFVRGAVAKVSPKYRPVRVQPEGFKAVTPTKATPSKATPSKATPRIGLIPPKAPLKTGETTAVKLPKTSPLKRGGFGVKPHEKAQFLSKDQKVATSQVGFFKPGKDIRLEREFFVTPQEPTLKIPETRVSRLGVTEPIKFQKDVQIGFGLPGKPQIGVARAGVGRVETPTQFAIGKGTELEAVKTAGTITRIKKVGVTTVKGQAVDIFTFKVGRGKGVSPVSRTPTTQPSARVSGEATLGVAGRARLRTTTKPTTTKATTIPTRVVTPPRPTTVPTRTRKTIGRTPITSPKVPTTVTPTIKIPPTHPLTTPSKLPFLIRGRARTARIPKRFGVEVRRRGRFRPVGQAATARQAITIGKGITTRTLAATFRITPLTGRIDSVRTPTGFRLPKSRAPLTFVEKRGKRLSTVGEVKEIKAAKRKKRRRR
jgi:hypothetical protein